MLPLTRLGEREQLVDRELDEVRVDRIGCCLRLRTDDRDQVVDVVTDRSTFRREATDVSELEAAITPELVAEETRDRLVALLGGTRDGARTLDAELVDVVAPDQVHDDLPIGRDRHDVGRAFAAKGADVVDLDVRATRRLLPRCRTEENRIDRDAVERVLDEHATVGRTKVLHPEVASALERLGEGVLIECLLVDEDLVEIGHALDGARAVQLAAVRQRLVQLRQLAECPETTSDALLGDATDLFTIRLGRDALGILAHDFYSLSFSILQTMDDGS